MEDHELKKVIATETNREIRGLFHLGSTPHVHHNRLFNGGIRWS